MPELWQFKHYYRPRVLIPVDDMLAADGDGRLLMLTDPQVNLIRNLLQYAHRRSTFVDEYTDKGYYAPNVEDWDQIEAQVAELEALLMTNCCDALQDKLDAILSQLEDCCTGEAVRDGMDVADPRIIQPYVDDGTFAYNADEPDTNVTGLVDAERCGLAQAWYQCGFEIATENVLPALRFAFDTLIPALAALIVVWTGGVGLPAAIGVYTIAELVQEILELGYNVAETNLYNWLTSAKEDLVCAMYYALLGETSFKAAWASVYADLVSGNPELSDGDELIVRFAFGGMAQGAAKKAQDEETAKYTASVVAGYCDSCTPEIVQGSNWYAVRWLNEWTNLDLVDDSDTAKTKIAFKYEIPSGWVWLGHMFQIVGYEGGVTGVRFIDGTETGACEEPTSLMRTLITTGCVYPNWGYCYRAANPEHDWQEAIATLHPGAQAFDCSLKPSGPVTGCAAYESNSDAGTGHVYIKNQWAIFRGTYPG